jgi:hypothetical protein
MIESCYQIYDDETRIRLEQFYQPYNNKLERMLHKFGFSDFQAWQYNSTSTAE